ncbi:MAG: hypothetical protein ABL958_07740 [Bdellovibrionia bacterium]
MKMIAIVLGLLIAAAAHATGPVEYFTLTADGKEPNQSCGRATTLALDHVKKTAQLEDAVTGICDIVVSPNRRTYYLGQGIGNGDGVRYNGIRRTVNGVDRIMILDSRGAVVGNPVKRLTVTEMTTTDSRTLYSVPTSR